jgi:signal transduction histidine kinase/DNA-binding NarL/FixJ family response regulator
VGRVVPHDAADIMLIKAGLVTIARTRGYSEHGSDETALPAIWPIDGIPNVARMVQTGETVLIADTHGHPDWVDLPGTHWIQSYIGVPIRVQGQVTGVLNLNSAAPGFFTATHAERLKAFADQAAIAIENAQLLAETRRQAEREHLINQIINRIRSSMDLDEVLRAAVQELGDSLGVSRCHVRLGADADYMPIAHEFVQPDIAPLGDRSSGLLPGTREKLMARQTLVIDDTRAAAPSLSQVGVRAILATPITVHHTLLGALVFHECDRPRQWQPDEIDLIETIAAQVGVAIENARLYHETRQQLSELTILHAAAIATAGSTSLNEALRQVAQSVQDAFGAVNVAVMLVDPDHDELTTRAGVGYGAKVIEQVHIRIGQGVTGWVAQTGQPALLPDVAADPRYIEVDDRIQSELCVPLKVGVRVIGVLNVESQQRDAFTERDLQLLTTLSHNLTHIVENIRLLEEVRAANEQLQELDRLKSQFLASMSHELRTPLNAIIGFSELLSDGVAGPLNADQHDYLHNIHLSGKHLLAVINDILDLSKIQAGRMTLDWRDFDMTQLIAEAQTFVAPAVARKQQQLSLNLPPNLPLVHADPLRIKQVLINLLSNACKFTPDGGAITVGVNLIEEDLLLVSVSDTGRGIPPSQQVAIFEEFRQVHGAAGKEEGTGLGLAIAQRLIELHGGKIWVESAGQPGLGSTFYFTLPMQTEAPEPAASHAALPTAVIVEDDQAFSDLLALHLHQLGYRTRQCYTGGQALQIIREVQPDLITLDMLLPEQDGWSILREMKSDPVLYDTGVLIISAQDQAQVAVTPGRVEYVSKPLLKSDLVDAIQRLKAQHTRRVIRVLVVDDDPMLIELLKAILPPPDYDVITAMNGLWAIEQMIDNLPDVIIVDLLMPDMNGFDLLSALRRDPRTHDLPVLVLTAKSLTLAERAELSRTAQGVMTKTSLRRERLLVEIDRLLHLCNTAAQATA